MKKILSTFLLSAMLVLVLGGCESEEKIAADSKEQKQIERLERQVEALMVEATWLHHCVRRKYNPIWMPCKAMFKKGGEYYWRESPFRTLEDFDAWGKKDYP